MNELLDTERVYVEELLCVLEVSLHLGDSRGTRWAGHPIPYPLWSVSTKKHVKEGLWQLYS